MVWSRELASLPLPVITAFNLLESIAVLNEAMDQVRALAQCVDKGGRLNKEEESEVTWETRRRT